MSDEDLLHIRICVSCDMRVRFAKSESTSSVPTLVTEESPSSTSTESPASEEEMGLRKKQLLETINSNFMLNEAKQVYLSQLDKKCYQQKVAAVMLNTSETLSLPGITPITETEAVKSKLYDEMTDHLKDDGTL